MDANLKSFLKLGYFLDYNSKRFSFDFNGVDRTIFDKATEEDLIEIGVPLLKNAIRNCYEPGAINVVPISGGLDSRAILSGLLEFLPAEQISTYTFGTPGTLDYEIGNKMAEIFGTNHTSFPLVEYEYNLDELLDISRRIDYQTMLFHHPPVWQVDEKFGGSAVWSGFMGGPVSGGRSTTRSSKNLREAKLKFIAKNSYVNSYDLSGSDTRDLIGLIDFPNWSESGLSLEEQLDIANRQLKYIAPHVLMRGYEYKTPFLDNDWSHFMLSVPNIYRVNQRLYKKIVVNAFPKAFSYGTKTDWGLPIGANQARVLVRRVLNKIKRIANNRLPIFLDKAINYVDFAKAIREKDDLSRIIYNSVMDLKSRKIIDWIDIDHLWEIHKNIKGNFADALIILASLEIHLKASETRKINSSHVGRA